MKINKKGFTLIELLAVVVIMLAISVMAISSISAAIERNKKKQDETKIAVIISYAELYVSEHKNTISCPCDISLADLNLTEKEITKANGDAFTGHVHCENGKYTYVE